MRQVRQEKETADQYDSLITARKIELAPEEPDSPSVDALSLLADQEAYEFWRASFGGQVKKVVFDTQSSSA